MDDVQYLSVGAAARALGVHPDTLRDWTRRGWIEATVLPSGHRRYSLAEIERIRSQGPRRGKALALVA